MSWMSKLYDTYEQAIKLDLATDDKLMPISHTLQNSHINIVIDGDGNFKRATVLEKTQIVLPATESSASRSSGEAPHPLADKLQYVAKDYAEYGGLKEAYFEGYKSQLLNWCESEFSHPKAKAVYKYIEKGSVIADLIKQQIVHVDNHNVLLTSWPFEVTEEHPIPLLFKVLPKEKGEIDQGNALVCWTVEIQGDPDSDTWKDESLQQSWVDFDKSVGSVTGMCFITGLDGRLALNHPAKLRHSGDKAKLISANDMDGFTFRGKFSDNKASVEANGYQSVGVGFSTAQKAHNALRWLISRQGFPNGEQKIITWAVSGKPVPEPMRDSYKLIDWDDLDEVYSAEEQVVNIDHSRDIGQSFAIKLNKKMAGYRANLGDTENIVIMAIDSATPGRMGITYYRECFAKEFIERLEQWHLDFSWPQRHTIDVPQQGGKKPKSKTIWPVSTPAPEVIARATYGKDVADSLKKNLYERLMPCIIEGQPFPIDIINSCIKRVVNRNVKRLSDQYSTPDSELAAWEKDLGITCALYRGFFNRHPDHNKRRNYAMSLETENTSRDYLYGRLLAIAERIEEIALSVAGEGRTTSAARLMQRFAVRPYSTWLNLELALQPYMQRLQNSRTGFLVNRKKELDDILNMFTPEDFTNDKSLSGEFLLGYHCQRQALRNKTETEIEPDHV